MTRTEELFKLRITELERIVNQLVQPKSRVRLLMPPSGGWIKGKIVSLRVASGAVEAEKPYTGLVIGTLTVHGTSPGRTSLIGTDVDMVDHVLCIADLDEVDSIDEFYWGMEEVWISLEAGAPADELTPVHWSFWDRCCTLADA